MMVSLRHRLVFFAMPKCASTALEAALAPHMDVVIGGVPSAKHTPYRKYNRFLRKYFEGLSDGPMETVCLFREPKDWLKSWWRYRSRPGIADTNRSTLHLPFEMFVNRYLDGARTPADVGRQSRFISDAAGVPRIDHLFQYGDWHSLSAFLLGRLGLELRLDRLNVSPSAHLDDRLKPHTEAALCRELALDYQIYSELADPRMHIARA